MICSMDGMPRQIVRRLNQRSELIPSYSTVQLLMMDVQEAMLATTPKRTRYENQTKEFQDRVQEVVPQILEWIDEGLSKKQAASRLGVHVTTVYAYLHEYERMKGDRDD
ncbi:Homeodomain-like domain-containing protein [Nitrosospira sp. Nl5]|uniref:helix-turn-helix domain-containing protein n=1 Tax=Nitrosospira sp. Nl5 TaxID=200120 RepID=UPI000891B331|nr:helix-turn-helix domain-containing protein [Nitrosospira sp. Nl5]SCX92436.1 Homeodomain-like domain-containing protein [Nitrosospira sp. Nl5]